MKGEEFCSDKALDAYIAVHHLFLNLAERTPALRRLAEDRPLARGNPSRRMRDHRHLTRASFDEDDGRIAPSVVISLREQVDLDRLG